MTRARAFSKGPAAPGRGRSHGVAESRSDTGATLPEPGEIIAGKYQVVRTLGEGGMAVVFEAQHLRLRQRLALKVLRPDIPDFAEVLERFEREARATAQLRSIHTARIVDVEELPNGLPYIVMEYLEGIDLDAALHATGPMPIEQAVDIVSQVAEAMAEAHAIGIVHRDLKPANLFVCRSRLGDRPLIKVLDFGISKSEDDGSARITQAHAYFGTPCYAAPEQLRSAGDADPRSDVWSLGIILYELVTGRTPFTGNATNVIAKVLSDPVPWPLEFRPDLPRELARVILKALSRDPAQRYAGMEAFADALAPFRPSERVSTATTRPRGRLGEILVRDGTISPADLQRALDEQSRTGVLLGRVLLDLGLVAHDDLLTALAKQQGITTPPSAVVTARPRISNGEPSPSSGRGPSRRRALVASAVVLALALVLALVLAAFGAMAAHGATHHASSSGRPAPASSR